MTNTPLPQPHRRWLFWLVLGISLLVFVYLIRSVLLPFVLGMLVAYFLDPAADKLQKLGFSRSMATLTIIATFFIGIAVILLLTVPVITNQIMGLIADMPAYMNDFQTNTLPHMSQWVGHLPENYLTSAKEAVSNVSGVMGKFVADFIAGIFLSGMAFVNLVSLILIAPIVAFYMLRDWDRIVAKVDDLLPREHAPVILEQCREIDRTLAGFIRGQFTVCSMLGVFYAVGLSFTGLKFGFLIGIFTGLLTIFPFIGLIVGMSVGMLVAVFQFGLTMPVLYVLSVFVTGQIIEGNFVTPRLVGGKVGLHPVWMIFAMLAGGALFGFVGVLLAVPVAAILGVLIRFAITRYRVSEYYNGDKKRR